MTNKNSTETSKKQAKQRKYTTVLHPTPQGMHDSITQNKVLKSK